MKYGLIGLFIIAFGARAAAENLPIVRIGIAIDGPRQPGKETMRDSLLPRIRELAQAKFDVSFPEDKMVMGDGSVQRAAEMLDVLLRDEGVDLIIAAGPIVSHDIARRGPLPKPVVAAVVFQPQVQGIPLQGDASGVENLSYISFATDVRGDLQTCLDFTPFKKAALLYNRAIGEALPALLQVYLDVGKELGVEGVPVPVDESAAEVLQALPEDAEAVFVAFPLRLPPDEFKGLVQGLIERRLPSFSAVGTHQVEAGLLVGLHPQTDFLRLARRIALNVQRISLGEAPETLPVVFTRQERVTINMATARAIDVYPNWGILTEAELLHQEKKRAARRLTLAGVVREALEVNLDLLASVRRVEAREGDVRAARAQLRPQVDLEGTGAVLDSDLASPLQPERSFSGSATLTQLVYAEPARANSAIQRHLQQGRRLEWAQLRLDIVQEAAKAYINVLRAEAFERVQRENLDLTRSNLEMARVRQTVGTAGPAEVFRWDSQIATARRNVIEANAQRNLAEIALNRLLHRPLEEDFETRETSLLDESLITHDPRFIRFIDSKSHFALFRSFMVEDGLRDAPELQRLDAAIAVQERTLTMARRAHWSPSVALQGSASNRFYDDGVAAPIAIDETNWTLGLNLSFPLYSGGAKFAAVAKGQEEVEGLKVERQALTERLEQRIRSALHLAGASYAGIRLSEAAALAAHRNLRLVKDAYERGVVSILDLLDAQNAAIVAEEGAANAVFDFLLDLMDVERAIGKFYFFAPLEAREAWFARLDEYFRQATGERE